ncbi:hypothetical protein BD779DRAFT_1450586, partial [Infundibulicybe gibba]
QELQDLVKWLSPLDFSEKQNTIFEKRAPDTGKWFLEHPKFLAWSLPNNFSGSGKVCHSVSTTRHMTLRSLVVHELGEAISEDVGLVYIYFKYKTKYTMAQLAEVILKQLIRRRITESGLESLRKHKIGNRPTFNELLDTLKVKVGTYSHVLVVVDALDEADVHGWAPLLRDLQALSGVSLLATSQDTGDIALELRPDQ